MAKQFAILTDKGRITFGLINRDTPTADRGHIVQLPTELRTFAGLPPKPLNVWDVVPKDIPQKAPNFTATLPNGNTITFATWVSPGEKEGNCTLTLEFKAKDSAVSPSRYLLNYDITINDPKYAGHIFTAGIFNQFPYDDDRHGVCGASRIYREFTDKDAGFYIGQHVGISGNVPLPWMAEFTKGAVAPDFPGPDNEKDPAGGDGEGPESLEDDPIEAPEDPGISAVDSGLLTLYVPSLNNIHEFGNFLWSDLFSLDTFKKLFADPMEAVIGISVLPISVPHTAGAESITIGQIESGVFAPLASKQFVKKDCGTLKVNPIWNTALDYDPYTKFSIYLPYIGTRDLKTDDIMGKDLNVSYLIDILSGSCTAHIKVGGSVLYQFSGSCAVPIPLSGTSWTNLLTSSIQLAGTGIAAAMTAGASTVVSAAATGMAVAGTAGLVSASKQAIQRTGAVSGAAGMLGVQFPYLIRETPRQSLAKGYNKFVGYPSNITSKLSDLKGFTQVEHIHLENLTCTADEAAEIEALLKEGVII